MKIEVPGKAHREGTAKRAGNPYNFNQLHCLGKESGVEGQAACTLNLDPGMCHHRPTAHQSCQDNRQCSHWRFSRKTFRSPARVIKLGHNHEYANEISMRMKSGESPDSITGDMKRRNPWTVSTSTLYRYIDAGFIPDVSNGDLLVKSCRKRRYHKIMASRAPAVVSIERRPQIVLDRSTFGHWEFEIIFKLSSKTAATVNKVVESALQEYPKGVFQSITVDNGSEFSHAYSLVYYCHPFCSRERGSNENCNRLVRRYFPKGQSIANRTQREADAAARAINNMHRKIPGYRTAQECFEEQLALLS